MKINWNLAGQIRKTTTTPTQSTQNKKNTLCSIPKNQRNEQTQKATFHMHNAHTKHCNFWLPQTSSAHSPTPTMLTSLQDKREWGGPCNPTMHRLQPRVPPLGLVSLLWFCLFYSSLSQFVVEQHAPSQRSRRPWCNDSAWKGTVCSLFSPRCVCVCVCALVCRTKTCPAYMTINTNNSHEGSTIWGYWQQCQSERSDWLDKAVSVKFVTTFIYLFFFP